MVKARVRIWVRARITIFLFLHNVIVTASSAKKLTLTVQSLGYLRSYCLNDNPPKKELM